MVFIPDYFKHDHGNNNVSQPFPADRLASLSLVAIVAILHWMLSKVSLTVRCNIKALMFYCKNNDCSSYCFDFDHYKQNHINKPIETAKA